MVVRTITYQEEKAFDIMVVIQGLLGKTVFPTHGSERGPS